MDEKVKVKDVQERLRKSLSGALMLGDQDTDIPIVAFDEVAEMPKNADTIVYRVTAELKGRGYRVANIRRFSVNTASEHDKSVALPYMQAGSDATLLALPSGRMILVKQALEEASLDDMMAVLGKDYDIIIGESFGYLPIPRFLMTDRIQESFNLGLPNVIAYISDKDARALIPRFSSRDIPAIADKIVADIIGPHAVRKARQGQARIGARGD